MALTLPEKHTYNPGSVARMQAGLCRRCEKPRSKANRSLCEAHAASLKLYVKDRYAKLKNAGVCIGCAKTKGTAAKLCEPCWYRRVAGERLGNRDLGPALELKMKAQNYRCPYSNRKLVPGENASVDHVMSVATHPELAACLDNVVWADFAVNFAKQDLTREEFVALCRDVVGHAEGKN